MRDAQTTPTIDAAWLRRPETQTVFAALATHGIEVRAVGGAVRNALLARPASDVDLATPAKPDAVMAAATAEGLAVIPTGLAHGTVTIVSGGMRYEVTTLRRDVETDGRHAVVAFTADWAADAARRDFTMNALYCNASGRVFDPLGCGLADLAARRVRFIGDAEARIREDYLRILRFFRFSATFAGGKLDDDALLACSRLRDGLIQLSAERVRTELLKLLAAPRAADVAAIMFEHGYWPALLGRVPWPLQFARRTANDQRDGRPPDPLERLAALAVASLEDATHLAIRLRLSSDARERLAAAAHLAPTLSPDMSAHAVRVALYRHGIDHTVMAAALAESRVGGDWLPLWRHLKSPVIPVFPVRGQDLIERGHAPSRDLGIRLSDLERIWIESDFTASREALLAACPAPRP